MENAISELAPIDGDAKPKEENESMKVMRRIVKRAFQLTENPQTNLEPTDVLKRDQMGGFNQKEYFRQLRKPKVYGDKKIENAVKLNWRHLGETSYIVLEDNEGNLVSVRHNSGTTASAFSIERAVEVEEKHEEIAIDVVRKQVISSGKFGVGKKENYFYEQIVLGGVPEKGMDFRISRGIQVKEKNKKSFNGRQDNFATSTSLSDLPPLVLNSSQTYGELDTDSLIGIEEILNEGKIDEKRMIQAMVRISTLLLTIQERKQKIAEKLTT